MGKYLKWARWIGIGISFMLLGAALLYAGLYAYNSFKSVVNTSRLAQYNMQQIKGIKDHFEKFYNGKEVKLTKKEGDKCFEMKVRWGGSRGKWKERKCSRGILR